MVQTRCSTLSVLLCMVQTQRSALSVLLCKVQTQVFYSVWSRLKCSTLYGPDSSVLLCMVQTQMFYSAWSRLNVLHSVFYAVWSRLSVLHSVFYSVRSRLKCSTLYRPDSRVLLCKVQTQIFHSAWCGLGILVWSRLNILLFLYKTIMHLCASG